MSLQSIREALTRHGPMTTAQLGARVGLGPSSISAQLKSLRERREVHIMEWILFTGNGPGRNTPIYALGNAPDAASKPRGKRALAEAAKAAKEAKAAAVQAKARAYAEVRQQAGMWGGLICSA
jgi:predicted ArsR family transcriptional regulator